MRNKPISRIARPAKQGHRRQPRPFAVCPQGHTRKRLAASLRTGSITPNKTKLGRDGVSGKNECRVRDNPTTHEACETKPMEATGAIRSVPVRAPHVAQPPLAGITAEGGGAPCVTTSGADSAKQSQRRQTRPFVVCPQGHIESNALRRHYKRGQSRQTKPKGAGSDRPPC